MFWQTSRHRIDLSRTRVMGIVNVTPDSFFDGGRHLASDAGRAHCDRLLQEGADILDIGGNSTKNKRPRGLAHTKTGPLAAPCARKVAREI